MSYKVLTDGNGSGLIRVVGMGEFMPLSQHEAMIKECEYKSAQLFEVMAERDALAAQVEGCDKEIFELTCFRIDVLRCLKTIAFEHNHQDVAKYKNLAFSLIKSIESNESIIDMQAEAGRAGFLEGVRQMCDNEIGMLGHDAESCANHYAARVRLGFEL